MSKATAPEIRFPEFEQKWKTQTLNHFLQVKTEKNIDERFERNDVLSVSGDVGVVNQIEHLGRSYAGASLKEYKILRTGEIVYTKSPLASNPYGIIKGNFGPSGIVSTLYAVYSVTANADAGFIDQYFESNDHMNRYIRPLVNKGAKNDMKVPNERVLIDPVSFPCVAEQKKITAFLTAIDSKLAAVDSQLASWRDYKRGMMQALFSQRLRFKSDNRSAFPNWTIVPLKKLVKRSTQKNTEFKISEVLSNSATRGVVAQGDYFDRKITTAANLDGYYIVEVGDFIYNPRVSSSAPVGPISRNNLVTGIMSPLYTVFRPIAESAPFLEAYFKSSFWNEYIFRASNVGARHDRMNIATADFMNMPIPLPTEPEQRKIVDALTTIDEKINALSDRFDAIREFKRGLLQKMFV